MITDAEGICNKHFELAGFSTGWRIQAVIVKMKFSLMESDEQSFILLDTDRAI